MNVRDATGSLQSAPRTAEPTRDALRNPLLRYLLSTRPAFLVVTACACLIGLASAGLRGPIDALSAAATLLFALLVHGAINLLNDYCDDLDGTDRLNEERVFPFTGGSRFIQNGVLSAQQVLRFAVALAALAVLGGLWLTSRSGSGLIAIGATGLLVGWAYSAPPLRLNGRGLGELCVALGFTIMVIGTDYVQRGAFHWLPVAAAASYALLVTNVLYINQFPDRRADEAAGKRHWVVILGARRARWLYVLIGAAAYAWLTLAATAGVLPAPALIALVSAAPTFAATRELFRHAEQPAKLAASIKLTILAAVSHGLLLAAGLLLA